MSLINVLKLQQAIKAIYPPPAMQAILEKQRMANSIHEKIGQILSMNNDPILKSIIDIEESNRYIKAFQKMQALMHPFSTKSIFRPKLSFLDYNLLDLKEDLPEVEIKEVEKIVVQQTKGIKRIITDIYNGNTNLLKVEPRQFEEMIAELLYAKGFEVELTKQTRDNGYDIIALKVIENILPIKFLVECKRFNKSLRVGVDIIRSFKEVIQTEGANKGMIVTTSYFTRDAKKKREASPYLLDFVDKDAVIEWVTEYSTK